MAFAPTKGTTLSHDAEEFTGLGGETRVSRVPYAKRVARPDLPPEKTSQIAPVKRRQIAIGHQQVLPAVVVDVGE